MTVRSYGTAVGEEEEGGRGLLTGWLCVVVRSEVNFWSWWSKFEENER